MWAAPRDDRGLFAALMVALIALDWLALWVWGQSPYGRFLSHHSLEAVRGNAALMLVFVAGWILMVVAMMLPTSLPLVALFRTLVRGRPDRTWLTVLLIAGYLAVWTLFGVVVYCGDFVLHGAVERSAWLGANVVPFIGAGTLLVAGLYQFTPLKYHCLEKCRSPMSFVTEHWRGSRERSRSFLLGAHHALFCVGCCWSLMLVIRRRPGEPGLDAGFGGGDGRREERLMGPQDRRASGRGPDLVGPRPRRGRRSHHVAAHAPPLKRGFVVSGREATTLLEPERSRARRR